MDGRLSIRARDTSRLACLAVLAAALLGCMFPRVASAESGMTTGLGAGSESEISLTPSTTQRYTPCPPEEGLVAECNMVIDPAHIKSASGYQLSDGEPLLGGGFEGGWDATNLQEAYNIPTSGGETETVALVDAYGDKTAEADLNEYRAKYKVYFKGTETACTKANEKGNGCFNKINVKGEEGEANEPKAGPPIWGAETALDIEMVSAACPHCHILLVEATGESPAETAAAMEEAVKWEEAETKRKVMEISNSYGYSEDDESACPSKKGCKEYLAAYDHPGIPVSASAGDGGYDNKDRGYSAPLWPAVSPNVMTVGGTRLEKVEKTTENPRGWKEMVWPESGSGCSLYELAPPWQEEKAFPKACGEHRTDNDVAAVAEDVTIYSTPFKGGWGNVGGTSASSPFIAGVEAHASSATKTLGADAFYKKPTMLYHVSEGSNGSCGTESESTWILCHASKEGYNGPTGEGTPDKGFESTAAAAATGVATKVTGKEATLNGIVNPNGLATKYYLEYGTTRSYGSKTIEASVGSGTSNLEEGKVIVGLTGGTDYHFRIVATNSNGTTDGTDQAFTTLPNPPENTVLPVISPTAPDQALPESTTTGTWTNSPTGYGYQWEDCNGSGEACTNIAGATSSTYTPSASDVGFTLRAKVTAKNSGGSNSASSAATSKVKPIGEITEYSLPSGSEPAGITTGPEGSLWFTEFATSKIGKITTSGGITEYALPKESAPLHITVGPEKENDLWFTDRFSSKIGKITTAGVITEYAVPAASEPDGITAGPDGNLWFTEVASSKIGKATTSGTITEYPLPKESDPGEITAGPDGNLWFTEWATNKIGEITTSGMVTEYSLPKGSDPIGIAVGPDKNLWFTDEGTGKIGKITTSGTITEYSLPAGYGIGITADPDGNLWFAEWANNKIGMITTSGTVTTYSPPSGSLPEDITAGPEGNLWFTDDGTSKIGMITG